jgi:hypothetical protein
MEEEMIEATGEKSRKKRDGRGRRGRDMRDRGYMTLEASFLVPIILLLLAGAILLFLTVGKKEIRRGAMYQSLYQITMEEEQGGAPLKQEEAIPYINRLADMGKGFFQTVFHVTVERAPDVCGNRLRRWQFYGDITEE